MGVVIESEVWEPNKALYVFLFISCVLSIFCLPTKAVTNVFSYAPPASFLHFQRKFLLLYAISLVMEGIWAVFGEYELAYYGFSIEQMLTFLSIGYAVSLFIGSFLGMLADLVDHKKLCLLFYMLHLFVSIWKIVIGTPTIWLLGQRQDLLNDVFWLMTLYESASFIGSQMLANYLIDGNVNKNIKCMWTEAAVLAIIAIIYVTRGWKEAPEMAVLNDYCISFHRHAISDKRIWLLSWAQLHNLHALFCCSILDSLGLNYSGKIEIGVLLSLFCLFQTCMGMVLPSLARLRTMYVPNEIRGGIMSLSLMPANAAVFFFLVLGGHYQYIGNSTITSFAALGLFSAAGCMHLLKKWGKQLHQSKHNL